MRGAVVVYVLFFIAYLAVMFGNLPYFVRFLKRDHKEHPMTAFGAVGMLLLYATIAWAPIALGRFVASGDPGQNQEKTI